MDAAEICRKDEITPVQLKGRGAEKVMIELSRSRLCAMCCVRLEVLPKYIISRTQGMKLNMSSSREFRAKARG